VSFVAREGFILGGIAGVAAGSMALAGYLAERNAEAQEDQAGPLLGRRVLLPDGRRLHCRDSRDDDTAAPISAAAVAGAGTNAVLVAGRCGGADDEALTVVFEAGRGETLLEWEPVVRRLQQSAVLKAGSSQRVRLVSYSRSGLGLSDAPPNTTTALPFPLYGLMHARNALPREMATVGDDDPVAQPLQPLPLSSRGSVGRTSGDAADDLVQLLAALRVRGPVVLVASGVGCLHARVTAHRLLAGTSSASASSRPSPSLGANQASDPAIAARSGPADLGAGLDSGGGVTLAGLVLVEPVVEGVALAHTQLVASRVGPAAADASLGEGLQRAALVDACSAKVGLARMKASANRRAQRQADLL
jgi:hypothetical protein